MEAITSNKQKVNESLQILVKNPGGVSRKNPGGILGRILDRGALGEIPRGIFG